MTSVKEKKHEVKLSQLVNDTYISGLEWLLLGCSRRHIYANTDMCALGVINNT